jgi:hypothetical protein
MVHLIVPEPTVTPLLVDNGSSGLALIEFRQAPQRCGLFARKERRSVSESRSRVISPVNHLTAPPHIDTAVSRDTVLT